MMFLLLLISVVGLVVYLSARWHSYAIVLMSALLPAYLVRFSVLGIPTNIFEVIVLSVLLGGLLSATVRHSWKTLLLGIPKNIKVLMGLFLFAATLSVFVSPHLLTSVGVLKGWIVIPIIFAWQVYTGSEKKIVLFGRKVDAIDALIASGVVVALVGISQIGQLPRSVGVYDVPNSLALFLSPLIILASVRRYAIQALIMGVALVATQSLAGVLAVLVVITGVVISSWRSVSIGFFKKHIFFSFLLTILAVVTIYVAVQKVGYLREPNSSAYVRLQLWSVSADLLVERPVVGVGLGTFEPAYQAKLHQRFVSAQYSPLPEFVFRDPHNWPLSFWLNTGLLGFVAFSGLHWYVLRFPRQWTDVHWALVCLLLFGLVDTIYWKNDLAALHWVLLFLAIRRRLD